MRPDESGVAVPPWLAGLVSQPPPEPEPPACSETTKTGGPCKGRPGDDGLCAAHKAK